MFAGRPATAVLSTLSTSPNPSFHMSLQNSPPPLVRDRILGLIQSWADAFRGKPDLQAAVDVYEQLKEEGREFPPLDLDALAPINTPDRVSVH